MLCCDVLWRGRVASGKVGSKVMLHLFMFVFLFQAKVLICVNVLLAQNPSLWLKYTDDCKFAYAIIHIRNSNDRTNKTHYHLFKSSWFLIGKEPTVKSSYSNQTIDSDIHISFSRHCAGVKNYLRPLDVIFLLGL